MKVGLIVEGEGEVSAVPVLMRRILERVLMPVSPPELLKPHRVKRNQLVREEEFKRAIELVARRTGDPGCILVMLDADDDLPCQLGPRLQVWAGQQRPDRRVSIIAAQREYEAWFLAAAVSLRGVRGLPADLTPPPHPETVRDAKGWLNERMAHARGYSPTIDQAALTARFDLNAARSAASFNKLLIKVGRLLDCPVPPLEKAAGC